MHGTEWELLINVDEILENSALVFHQLQQNTSVQMDGAQMATLAAEYFCPNHMLLRRERDAGFDLKLWDLQVPHGALW